VLRKAVPSLISQPTFAGPALGPDRKVKLYLGEHAALLVDRAGRRSVVAGTAALRVPDKAGREVPVDMRLERRAGFYEPANSATPVRLPSRLGQGLHLERSGFGLTPLGATGVSPRRVRGRLFYANAYRDADILISPTTVGAEVFTELRSVASPTQQSFALTLPRGAVAAVAADGHGVDVTRDGTRVASIPTPVAWDADGQVVPTSYRLAGRSLVISTAHRHGSFRYPITVDPYAIEDNDFRSANTGDASFIGWNYFQWHTGGNAVGVAQSGAEGRGLYLYVSPGWTIPANDYAAWTWKAPVDVNIFEADSFASMVPFYGYFTMQRGIVNSGPAWAPGNPVSENGVTLRDGRRLQCADGYNPPSAPTSPAPPVCPNEAAGSLANEFWILYQTGYNVTVGGFNNTYAYLSLAWLYMHDGFTPTITGVTATETAGAWRKGGTTVPPFTVSAADRGLGMDQVDVTGGSVNAISKPQCLGRRDWRCPLTAPNASWNTTFTYNTDQLPEGVTTMKASAHDIAGNIGTTTWSARVDKTDPMADTTGELDIAGDVPRLTTDTPNLDVQAFDDSDSVGPTSGVASIKVQIDGADPTVTNPYTAQNVYSRTGACDSCSLQHEFQFDTSRFGDGIHTVDVIVTDIAGNSSDQTWDFTIDRTSPRPFCSDPTADQGGCQPDPPSSAAASCAPPTPLPQPAAGATVTAAQAVAQTQQTLPSALAQSELAAIEGLNVQPALVAGAIPAVSGYTSTGTVLPSAYKGTTPSYSVGSGTTSTCTAPATTTSVTSQPQLVNGTALEYANSGPSTDTILRPAPLGVQEIDQIRDGSAPETVTYQVGLGSGQSLQPMDDGSIAIVDSTAPTISSTMPPDAVVSGGPANPRNLREQSPAFESEGDSDDTSLYTVEDLAELKPAYPDILAPKTLFQYQSEKGFTDSADQDTDGQLVGLVTPPFAKDANGLDVPTSMAISGTNTYTVTTSHRQSSYAYPVMTSRKTTTTKKPRHRPYQYQMDGDSPNSFSTENTMTHDGVPKLIAARHMHNSRHILYFQNSCDAWDGRSGGTIGADLRSGTQAYADISAAEQAGNKHAARCRHAIDYVEQVKGLTPSITIAPYTPSLASRWDGVTQPWFTNGGYALSVIRLMEAKPFDQVKIWAPVNEPDYGGTKIPMPSNLQSRKALSSMEIWRRVRELSSTKDKKNASKVPCKNCKIVAGEFARANPRIVSRNPVVHSDQYMRDYMNSMQEVHTRKPYYWSFHDYPDVTYQAYHKHQTDFVQLNEVEEQLHKRFGNRVRLFLDEQGVLLHHGSKSTPVRLHPDLQAKNARRFLRLVAEDNYNIVTIVGYYEWFGDPNNFDSGLVRPPQEMPGGVANPNDSFRASYCVLAKRSKTVCDQSVGD
jgi:hypothetical protein